MDSRPCLEMPIRAYMVIFSVQRVGRICTHIQMDVFSLFSLIVCTSCKYQAPMGGKNYLTCLCCHLEFFLSFWWVLNVDQRERDFLSLSVSWSLARIVCTYTSPPLGHSFSSRALSHACIRLSTFRAIYACKCPVSRVCVYVSVKMKYIHIHLQKAIYICICRWLSAYQRVRVAYTMLSYLATSQRHLDSLSRPPVTSPLRTLSLSQCTYLSMYTSVYIHTHIYIYACMRASWSVCGYARFQERFYDLVRDEETSVTVKTHPTTPSLSIDQYRQNPSMNRPEGDSFYHKPDESKKGHLPFTTEMDHGDLPKNGRITFDHTDIRDINIR